MRRETERDEGRERMESGVDDKIEQPESIAKERILRVRGLHWWLMIRSRNGVGGRADVEDV